MASIYPKDFTSNSLTGTVVVAGGQVTVTLTTRPFALEGNKSFIVKLRKNNPQGEVVAMTPSITYQDNSSFVSLTANTYTISEGNLISYTLTASNAPDGSLVYYSVKPGFANVTINDFYNKANSGYATFLNNTATIVLQANTDTGYIDETGEVFTLQLRANSTTGPILYQDTANVTILDFYKSYRFNSLTANNNNILNGGNIFFRLNTTNANNLVLYYSTTNVTGISENLLFPSNTGSLWVNNEKNQTVISLASNISIPLDSSATFQLQVRSGSVTGPVLITSNVVTMIGYSSDNLLSGGTLVQGDGFNYHVFTTSGTLQILKIGIARPNVQYLVVAGGGGAGYSPGAYPGGGGAGGILTSNTTFSSLGNLTVQVGAGGTGETSPGTPSYFGPLVAYGGGGGGEGRPGFTTVYPGGSGGGLGIYTPTAYFSANVVGQGYPGAPGGGFPSPGKTTGSGGGGGGEAGYAPTGPSTAYRMGSASGGNGLPITWLTYGSYLSQFGANGFDNVKFFAGGGGGASSSTIESSPGGFGGGGGNYKAPLAVPFSFRLSGNAYTGGGAGGAYSTGAISGGSGIVILRYPYDQINTIDIPRAVVEGTNITIFANIYLTPSPQTLYWSIVGGNATSANFVSNTGTYNHTTGNTFFNIGLSNNLIGTETRTFQVQLRKNAANNSSIFFTSNLITIYGYQSNVEVIATGGNVFTITDGGKTYAVHAITSSTNFAVTQNKLFVPYEYVILAGGGGGGGNGPGTPLGIYGAGGGAGGYLQGNVVFTSSEPLVGTYTAVVGTGGTGFGIGGGQRGGNGTHSYLVTSAANIVAFGGGGGGSAGSPDYKGHPGGSGGGGAYSLNPSGGFGNPLQGYPGGTALGPGGGGGAGGAGGSSSAPLNEGGDGGVGINISWMPSSYGAGGPGPGRWFGGGGAGASVSPLAPAAGDTWKLNVGGLGGGGYGGAADIGPAPNSNTFMMYGNVNTGGGGGGGSSATPVTYPPGAPGGSGVIFIRYLNPVRQ